MKDHSANPIYRTIQHTETWYANSAEHRKTEDQVFGHKNNQHSINR